MAKVRTICPIIACPSHDGVILNVEGNKITGTEGDRNHPRSKGFICRKGREEWRVLYHPKRYTKPLLKTKSGFKEISWDEAIQVASDRLGEVIKRFGPTAICTILPLPPMELFTRSLGTPNGMSNDDLCQGTAEVADILTCGDMVSIYRSAQDFANSKCVLLAGTNLAHSSGGQWQDVLWAKEKGCKLIVVDPQLTEVAQAADLYLQIRPGTDGALALAMLNTVIQKNLYDKDFVHDYCVGFEQLTEHVKQYTPEWASKITWVKPELIVEAARMYACNGPASYRGNIGVCQHSNSTQAARALTSLVAITGNLDVEGGNRLSEPPQVGFQTIGKALYNSKLPEDIEDRVIGAENFPLWAGTQSVIHRPHNPTIINAMITGQPYPIKSWLIQYSNPAMSFAGTYKIIEAMKRLEFIMVLAYTPSATTEFADLILPIAHAYEQNSIAFCNYGNWVSATPKIVESPEGCREDMRIFYDIAAKMVQRKYISSNFVPWQNYDAYVAETASEFGMSYEELCNKGTIVFAPKYRKYIKSGFNTPSHKVELFSSRMETFGYSGLPIYIPCGDDHELLPQLAKKYPLYLTSRRSREYLLTRSSDYEWVRKSTPDPILRMHPDTAESRGISDGDWVFIDTPKGSMHHRVSLTNKIHPMVVNAVFGWWLPENENIDGGTLETNVNNVTSYDPPYDPVIGINRVQGVMCEVRKAN